MSKKQWNLLSLACSEAQYFKSTIMLDKLMTSLTMSRVDKATRKAALARVLSWRYA